MIRDIQELKGESATEADVLEEAVNKVKYVKSFHIPLTVTE